MDYKCKIFDEIYIILNIKKKKYENIFVKYVDLSNKLLIIELEMTILKGSEKMRDWIKKTVVYQIYPKSFKDTNADGIGDIQGIIEKLDYLKELGVGAIWITPIYKSPQKDNGYDISDYYNIDEMFGTMDDFDKLLKESHKREIKIIMDIVVNHTSTENKWFKEAIKNKESKYRDYYIFRKGKDNMPPNNWRSMFGGSAWERVDGSDDYYLHLFDVSQADLNWENKDLRKEVYDMMNYWMKKGVDGFRLDVINLISKVQEFPMDDQNAATIGKRFYVNGPRIHEYLKEMNREVFSKYNSATVGETMSVTTDIALEYTKPENKELDMIFAMSHLKGDYLNGDKWTYKPLDLNEIRSILSSWQNELNSHGAWNSLFWSNHDQPRAVSRFGNDKEYREESAKMLATTIHMLKGTPYMYQGEEIGMTNPDFEDINDYNDIETLNIYKERIEKGIPENKIMDGIRRQSRDNARTPMQWNEDKEAGFTKGKPWLKVASNYKEINVEKALSNKDSIFYHYKKLINLRREEDIITLGSYRLIDEKSKNIWAYTREYNEEVWLIISNFFDKELIYEVKDKKVLSKEKAEIILSNYKDSSESFKSIKLRPYESIIYKLN